MDSSEEWREIPFARHILVSDQGRFKNARTGTLKRTSANGSGYLYLPIYVGGGKTKAFLAARLVIATFLEDYNERRRIRYKDGDRHNIALENLICMEPISIHRENLPPPRPHAVRVRIKELDKVFLSGYAAARYIQGHPSSVYACLRGDQHRHLGYTFEYVTTQEMLHWQRRRDARESRS